MRKMVVEEGKGEEEEFLSKRTRNKQQHLVDII
jgi:hypothetical protein